MSLVMSIRSVTAYYSITRTSVKLVSDSDSDSFSDSKMHNCKSKTKLIHEIQGGARGATYVLLNCVENNLKNRDN